MRFEVWAPKAHRLELELGGRRLPMTPGERGWYGAEAEAVHGTDYSYVLDGDRLPDPRSPWQPAGVHGPSRTVDHSRFDWHDQAWRCRPLRDLVLYELHVGTFSAAGTFAGAVEHLDHLVELGVGGIELMPVCEFAGDRGWGYDGVDLWAPHHAYGGPEGLKKLVDEAHTRGLAVVLDVVYNHFGPEGNYLSRFGPYLTDRYSTPWGDAVNFDGRDSAPVRDFCIQNAQMWLRDYHLDGLRLDAVHAIFDRSALHILEELRAHTPGERFLVAESDLNDPRLVTPVERGGYGLDAQWADDIHHALHALLTGERVGYYRDFGSSEQLAKALRGAYVYDGLYSEHRARRHGRPHALGGEKFVACSQNHDQIGNRARGERTAAMISPARLRMAAALVLCGGFVPLLFMGEEWAASTPFLYFSSHTDPELARATSEGRVREFASFGWSPEQVPDPQAESTLEASRLRWAERAERGHAEMLEWYRGLLALRRALPEVRAGDLDQLKVQVAGHRLRMRNGPVTVTCDWEADSVVVSPPPEKFLG
ncbi:MAG: malto-oligosyltrehalose trehalohydrolase [Chloroflexi bacterium]|nr:MAG: malto-oligosyltrehalose trehalohydrolase [Chloroflexota bacterium]